MSDVRKEFSMLEDKNYCMNAFLMYRSILKENVTFKKGVKPFLAQELQNRHPIRNGEELIDFFKRRVKEIAEKGTVALALSGGIDSAILAKFMPKGATAYIFKCVVPGKKVLDETPMAKKFAEICGLNAHIIEIYWEDFAEYAPILMQHKGAPIHSIEVQIYKAALRAKQDGVTHLIFGENADIIYGGMSGLLSREWTIGDFIDRYSYILPYKVLKDAQMIVYPYQQCEVNGYIDVHKFINKWFRLEALGSYFNACETAGVYFEGPYAETVMAEPLDYAKVRNGQNKYIVREAFAKLYPDMEQPEKVPMPRPMEEWLNTWNGPEREEFYPNCAVNMTGDQKWMLWALEKFLNLLEMKR